MPTPEDRHPLLGRKLDGVQVRHDQELDALAADFEELRSHHRDTEPRLLAEWSEVRRLRQELTRTSKETKLCERSLEHAAGERERQKLLSEDSATRVLQLETRAEEMIHASPALQRHLYVETETDCLRLERQELSQQVRKLDQDNISKQQRIWQLSKDVARRAADLNMTAASGAPLLRGLADAYDAIAVAGPSIEAAGMDVSGVARDMKTVATELESEHRAHSTSLTRLLPLEAALAQLQREHDSVAAQRQDERDMQEELLQAAADLSEESVMQRAEACNSNGTAFDLQRVYSDLQADLQRTEMSMRSVLDAHLGRCQALAERNVELEWEVQRNSQRQNDLQLGLALQADPTRLSEMVSELREDVHRMQAQQHELWRYSEHALVRQRVQRDELREAKRASLVLLASWRSSQERCRNLQADRLQSHRTTEDAAREAACFNSEREQSLQDMSVARRRSKDALEYMGIKRHEAEDLDAQLQKSVSLREMLQEGLSSEIAVAAHQLQDLREARHRTLREAAALRHESDALRRVLVE